MALIHIDGTPYEVNPGHNLLEACLSLGMDLPYFCWHPAMGSVGSCRQCAVKQFKDANDDQGKIVIACMTPAADGTYLSIADPEARAFRAGVIEWLMTNHPHDCPVCEEGGECHLQDMTLMTGHTRRRYRFGKRTFRNQDLGPFIGHEMNRCITCYRCVRFYRDYAGGDDLHALAAHNHVYFGRHQDGVLENEFSGNLVEVCPTGVFTDKTLGQHYVRKWDLQTAPSLCPHCSLGCNISPGERYGRLRRIVNRYHHEINGYFLCDRGRFGYGFVNREERPRRPLLRRSGTDTAQPATETEALDHLASLLAGYNVVIGIGSPRASLEANFALRTLVGADKFYAGVSAQEQRLLTTIEQILATGPARIASLQDVEQADAVLVLGEDVTNTAPRLALSLRQAVRCRSFKLAAKLNIPAWQDAAVREAAQHDKSPLFVATPAETRLDSIATRTYRGAPADLARLGFAIAHALDSEAPPVTDLAEETRDPAETIAGVLRNAERPLVVSGTGCHSEAVLQAAANVAGALCRGDHPAKLCLIPPECNSLGLGLLDGGSIEDGLKAVRNGEADTVVVLENDLYRRAERESVDAVLNTAQHVVVIDHQLHATARRAELVLPAGTFAETDGTLINNEGRAQRFFQVYPPGDGIRESWRWLAEVMTLTDRNPSRPCLDDLTRACADAFPRLAGITQAAPSARFRIAGLKIPRQPHRYSGRTAMQADQSVHEPQAPRDPDSPLAFSMEGYEGQPPAALVPFVWAPGWSSNEALNKFQDEVNGPLRGGDPGVRLIEPAEEVRVAYFNDIPAAFERREEQWLVVPLHHIFGSEELSVLAPAVAERSPSPYLALNPEDAKRLGVDEGDAVELSLNGSIQQLPARLQPALASGLLGLPLGLPGMPFVNNLPAWAKLSKAT